MNWPSARSSRASWPFSTVKREPDNFAARSKSIMPSASPISKCSFTQFGRVGHLADLADLDIVVLVLADRHIVERHVGDDGQFRFHSAVDLALARLARPKERLDLGDLALQPFGQRHVAGAHGVADLLRGGVAALLLRLQFAQMSAAILIQLQDGADGRPSGVFRIRALDQRLTSASGFSRIHLISSMHLPFQSRGEMPPHRFAHAQHLSPFRKGEEPRPQGWRQHRDLGSSPLRSEGRWRTK